MLLPRRPLGSALVALVLLAGLAVGPASATPIGGWTDLEPADTSWAPGPSDACPSGSISGAGAGAVGACRYLVRLAAGASPRALARSLPSAATARPFGRAVRGLSAVLTPAEAAALRTRGDVLSVTPDQVATIQDTEADPPWGLDRIDQRALPLTGSYEFDPTGGSGVTAYVIDTGILATHQDFAGRVGPGVDTVPGGHGTTDCHGHGSHVAGTIGGATYGVAKAVTLVPVRVLDCSGSGYYSWIIAGLDWVIADHHEGEPAVANLSFGGGYDPALNAAIASLAADGIVVAVAAGNSDADACGTSPASAPEAITVGATDQADRRAAFSNVGPCLDLFAPGVSIQSAGIASDTSSVTQSGTSMASPHVAGIAAVIFGRYPTADADAVATALIADATPGAVGDPESSPNRLAHADLVGPIPGTIEIDETAPTTSAPFAVPRTGVTLSGARIRLRLSWSGSDGDGSGIDHYVLSRSRDGGAHWTTIRPALVTSSTNVTAPRSGTVRYRVRAVDRVGFKGAWRSGPIIHPALVQQSSPLVAYRGPWSTAVSARYSAATASAATVDGAAATYSFSGRAIAVVATVGPTRGKVRILVNGRHRATVDLEADSRIDRSVVWAHAWSARRTRTIRLVVVGRSGHPRVDLDAFAVLG